MNTVLILYHSKSGNVEQMAYAIKRGIEKYKNILIELKKAQDANWEDLEKASGLAIGTPNYFDDMAGTIKDFFDRTFYPSQSKIAGSLTANLPCVFFVSGGANGKSVIERLTKISKSFRFNVIGYITGSAKLTPEVLNQCEELGEKLAIMIQSTKEK